MLDLGLQHIKNNCSTNAVSPIPTWRAYQEGQIRAEVPTKGREEGQEAVVEVEEEAISLDLTTLDPAETYRAKIRGAQDSTEAGAKSGRFLHHSRVDTQVEVAMEKFRDLHD